MLMFYYLNLWWIIFGFHLKVFLATSFPTDANRVEERVKKMATNLARVSLRQWMFAGLDKLEEKFSSDFYVRFEESSFKSFAKFILHMTDMVFSLPNAFAFL